ncbi:premnaspirodiene oxygenase-like [Mercurialis annua]|uniref:premnaspirodiene oxygenase-like n=1 Tax=Mercurialis annua TaxID=3986 RepID=UPI0021604039|nr:premnaspirodiene oxygenase-like [Mercurialis annua]
MNLKMLSFPFLILISVLFVLQAIWRKLKSSKPLNLPPGPSKLPIIGNMHQLIGGLPHHKLGALAKKYGPLFLLQIGQVPTAVISSPDTAKQVMKTHDTIFAQRPFLLVADIVFYKAADIGFARYGEHWRQMRKICILELLSAKRVQLFRPIREEAVSNLISSIYSSASSAINLTKMLNLLSCSIITRAAFGKKCLVDQEEFIPIVTEVVEMLAGFNIADLFPSIKLLHFITGIHYRLKKLHKKVDLVLENIINTHKKSRAASKIDLEDEDIVHVLLNLQEQGNLELPLTTDSIKAVILDLFIAGVDTSALTLGWVMSELIKNPRAMQKAQAEVRQLFGDKGIVDETGFEKLKYFKLIIKETLRLHPPAPLVPPREASEQCQIDGYDIPAMTRVLVNVWAIGRDPNYWIEPETFLPERFEDGRIDFKGNNFEYLPFGGGRRICPGISFAMATVELALAHLLFHFDWELPNGMKKEELDMTEDFLTSTKRKYDLNVVPIPYSRTN